jgi:hypothetical protein
VVEKKSARNFSQRERACACCVMSIQSIDKFLQEFQSDGQTASIGYIRVGF